jgi:hypothetical protein
MIFDRQKKISYVFANQFHSDNLYFVKNIIFIEHTGQLLPAELSGQIFLMDVILAIDKTFLKTCNEFVCRKTFSGKCKHINIYMCIYLHIFTHIYTYMYIRIIIYI